MVTLKRPFTGFFAASQLRMTGGELVKYLPYGKCEIMPYGHCEI